MKKTVTWVVVADHQRARVLANGGPGSGLTPVAGMDFETRLKPSRDIFADRPGRKAGSDGQARHAVPPRSDAHREAARRFVARVAKALASSANKGAYDRLVLIAPPKALGEFRKLLPAPVKDKVIGERAEDLTKEPVKALGRHVADFMCL